MEKILKMCDISSLQKESRPADRLRAYGPGSLTDNELMSVILGENFIADYGGMDLLHMSINDMTSCGISAKSALKLYAFLEYAKRLWKKELHIQKMSRPADIASYMTQEMRWLEKEELRILCLDVGNRLIKEVPMTKGSSEVSIVCVNELLSVALKEMAHSIVMVHNHPCSDPTPSTEDIEATRRVREGCQAVGITLTDHIIIGENNYYSFTEKGML